MTSNGRRFWVGGNWKMNTGTAAAAQELVKSVCGDGKVRAAAVDIVLAPPATVLHRVATEIGASGTGNSDTAVSVAAGAQNCHFESKGAFTGELAPEMVLDTGATWVVLGHSERRTLFGETDEGVKARVTAALRAGLCVCACIGETLQEREADQTKEVVFRQSQAIIDGVTEAGADAWSRMVIAYEPVWAIGTGKVASAEQAQEVHAWLRGFFAEKTSRATSDALRIVYGGSVKPGNSAELGALEDIDGFLVGGASLLAADFAAIVASAPKSNL
jgi:triosephosphate isomerase (TIM)